MSYVVFFNTDTFLFHTYWKRFTINYRTVTINNIYILQADLKKKDVTPVEDRHATTWSVKQLIEKSESNVANKSFLNANDSSTIASYKQQLAEKDTIISSLKQKIEVSYSIKMYFLDTWIEMKTYSVVKNKITIDTYTNFKYILVF